MRSKFDPAIRSIPNVTINDDPYVKFIIDRRQHEGIFHDLVGAQTGNAPFPIVIGKPPPSLGRNTYE